MRVIDGERAQRPERAGDLEMRNHDHHAEQKRDGVEIDGVEGLLEAQRPECDTAAPPKNAIPARSSRRPGTRPAATPT